MCCFAFYGLQPRVKTESWRFCPVLLCGKSSGIPLEVQHVKKKFCTLISHVNACLVSHVHVFIMVDLDPD